MDFEIVPGALCVPASMGKIVALEGVHRAGTDIFRQISREFIR